MLLKILTESSKHKLTTRIMSKKDIEENGMSKYARQNSECDSHGVYVDGKWAGMITIDHGAGSIQWVYIADEFRGKKLGIFHKLFSIRDAQDKILRVNNSNTTAVQAYERMGFKKCDDDGKSSLYNVKVN